ncbi:ABC transporter ATP-binding protein [Mumia sp. Pv 4-285]|uniref:ABC transporter ATP-binding protein n=1 Tax=Mumia qirimensis TaxID=3234852 RepID=UPI00351CE4DF
MGEARLEARRLVRGFADGEGVSGVDIEVRAGEIHALVGLNGAGKTTLMRMLLGMLRPTDGVVRVDGRPPGSPDSWRRVGHMVGGPFAYPEMTTRTNLVVAARLRLVPEPEITGVVDEIMAELDLGPVADKRARMLSQGNLQRVGLAVALVHDPLAAVLDEPTNALDPAGVLLLRASLRRRADAGAGIFVSSHHLDEVARVADRITVMNRGRVVGTLDPRETELERRFFATVHADDLSRSR